MSVAVCVCVSIGGKRINVPLESEDFTQRWENYCYVTCKMCKNTDNVQMLDIDLDKLTN